MATKKQTKSRARSTEGREDHDMTSCMESNFMYENVKLKKPFLRRPGHDVFHKLMMEQGANICLVSGGAGTAKTHLAVRCALEQFLNKDVNRVVYVRSAVESADSSLGFLPGELDDKFGPYSIPLMEKIHEISTDTTLGNTMMNNKHLSAEPVNFARGTTFRNSFVIIDEAQNMTKKELTTLLTRFGEGTKYVICGDMKQADIKSSGFAEIFHKFDNEECRSEGIHCLKYGPGEIVRSKMLKFIVKVLEV